MRNYYERAKTHFADAEKGYISQAKGMAAEFSAAGRLRSGATAKASVRCYGETSRAALREATGEIGRLIEHRGKEWDRANDDIVRALAEHQARAQEMIAPMLKLSTAHEGAAKAAVDKLLDAENDLLARQAAEFRSGWTAPTSKAWHERHPALWAVLLVGLGALAGKAVILLAD